MTFRDLFPVEKPVIGMVHLAPLPGSPCWGGSMEAILRRAVADARAWVEGGADALLVENFGDAPFSPAAAEPHTVAAITLALRAVQECAALPTGVNVLRNDAGAALGIAAVSGGQFIRVNVHTGAMATDQGILQGRAHSTLRLRRCLGASVLIFADIMVKHAAPLAAIPLGQVARDTFHRGLADALIVSGAGTGQPTPLADVDQAREAVPEAPILVGSGVDEENVGQLLAAADGVIVGTSVKAGGVPENPVDPDRVLALMQRVRELRENMRRGS